MNYTDCEVLSRAYFGTEDNLSMPIPDLDVKGGPPCPICGMPTEIADIISGELGWNCHVCGLDWCRLGCHGQRQEDWEGWC